MLARLIAAAWLIGIASQAQAVWVRLIGLGPDRAELQINRTTVRVMRPGDSTPEGVRLISLTANSAQVEANGFSYQLTLGQRIEPMVVLKADNRGHYTTNAVVNGHAINALVDTGATTVAFSRSEAERIGLPFRNGRLIKSGTAGGETDSYLVMLKYVQVGPILLRDVEATVSTLADSPPVILLGMSFLRRLEMSADGDSLRLMYLK